jgi:hypothetical protein
MPINRDSDKTLSFTAPDGSKETITKANLRRLRQDGTAETAGGFVLYVDSGFSQPHANAKTDWERFENAEHTITAAAQARFLVPPQALNPLPALI